MAQTKQALIAELNRAAREASGIGNLFASAVAARLAVNPTDVECLGIIESATPSPPATSPAPPD